MAYAGADWADLLRQLLTMSALVYWWDRAPEVRGEYCRSPSITASSCRARRAAALQAPDARLRGWTARTPESRPAARHQRPVCRAAVSRRSPALEPAGFEDRQRARRQLEDVSARSGTEDMLKILLSTKPRTIRTSLGFEGRSRYGASGVVAAATGGEHPLSRTSHVRSTVALTGCRVARLPYTPSGAPQQHGSPRAPFRTAPHNAVRTARTGTANRRPIGQSPWTDCRERSSFRLVALAATQTCVPAAALPAFVRALPTAADLRFPESDPGVERGVCP